MLQIDDNTAFVDYVEYLKENPSILELDEINRIVRTADYTVQVQEEFFPEILEMLSSKKGPSSDHDSLIYGKDRTENIVSIEIVGDNVVLFREVNGEIITDTRKHKYWMLANKPSRDGKSIKLEGNQFYKYMKEYTDVDDWNESRKLAKKFNLYVVTNPVEGSMIRHGYTFFKNTKISDVSVLSFDIETSGLDPKAKDAQVFMITNTFRKLGVINRKLFSVDEYASEKEMLLAWVRWVQESNPSIVIGHNIVSYDFPYLMQRAADNGIELNLGRDCSPINKEEFTRNFRKDGSQSYQYNRINIFGRSILDTFFISIKYDIGRKYTNYRLKTIVAEEGLEKKGRTFVNAANIKNEWKDEEKRKLIKLYGEEDSDDALKLYDLMIAGQFYLCQYIPKSFQVICESATGAQINSLMVRSYLQDKKSIALPSEPEEFQGALSAGHPGIYSNTFKIDIASLYPSIMRQYKVYDKSKDTDGNFLKVVEYFTLERLANKKLSKETCNRHYKDLEQSQKILANSTYGFMGASGLNYNSPKNAAFVTRIGREILQKTLDWVIEKNFIVVNLDTDSVSFTRTDGSEFTDQDQLDLLDEINSKLPELIRFENDGVFKKVIVVKAKNYVLYDGKKISIKGSGLKITMKESALREMTKKFIDSMLDLIPETPLEIYHSYIREIYSITDVSRWTSRKTITKSVLKPERSNEQKVADAIQGAGYTEGDKVNVYFKFDGIKEVEKVDKHGKVKRTREKMYSLKLQEHWENDHAKEKLLEKLYKNVQIFTNVLDRKLFLNYNLSKNQKALEELLGG